MALLSVDGLEVSFDGFLALRNLNLTLGEHERVRLLIGPNGAGKSTFFDALTGYVEPAAGRVLFKDGTDLLGLSEHAIARRGVIRKFQTPSLFPQHTVLENMMLALRRESPLSAVSRHALRSRQGKITEVLEQVGLMESTGELAGTLSHGQQQWLEIGMLLVQDPTLLLLDEPVAGMTKAEKEKTAALIEAIVRQTACAVMLIEHDMEFVRHVARDGHLVTVLHEGCVLSEGSIDEVQADERVVEAYLGRGTVG